MLMRAYVRVGKCVRVSSASTNTNAVVSENVASEKASLLVIAAST